MDDKYELVVGQVSRQTQYSTYFDENFNVDGSPSSVDLENIFNAPQDNIDDIVGYAKYCYRKYGIIMRTINITRDFGASGIKLSYPVKDKNVKKVIDEYNKRIDVDQLIREFIQELALTGNLACYDREGMRVDIYPINKIKPIPLIENNKQMIAYVNDTINFSVDDYGEEINALIATAYPKEIREGMAQGKQLIPLDINNAYFVKINASQYESYGMPVILPAFDDLAHKSLLKEAEKAVANDIIDKIMLIKVGDSENKPTRGLIEQYTALLDGLKGSVRLTVPYYVDAKFVEPETTIFESEKFVEVDTDILNALGISLSLIRGESGGNYSEGIINFSGLVRTIETIQAPIVKILEGLYAAELKRRGFNPEHAPKVKFREVVIDNEAKLNLVKDLFTNAGLPYQVLYDEYGYDFDHIKLIREDENSKDMDDIFAVHSMPFSSFGNNQNTQSNDEGGAPEKSITERKSDKSQSNNNAPRTGVNKGRTNRSAQ